jgi:hypothetical protein
MTSRLPSGREPGNAAGGPAGWWWPLSIGTAVLIGGALAVWRVANLDGGLDWPGLFGNPMRGRWLVPAAVLGSCCWLGLATWRGVRPLRDRPAARTTWRYGIAAFAPAWGLVMVVLRAIDQVRALAPGGDAPFSLVAEVVLREAVIAFPLALWAGYVVGRVLTYFFERLGVPPR